MINRIEIVSNHNENFVQVYTVEKSFKKHELDQIALALANPVNQRVYLNNAYSPKKFSFAVEIGYLAGVTDNIATTTKQIIEDLLKKKFDGDENVYTSQIYFLPNNSKTQVVEIVYGLHNPVIQKAKIKSLSRFKKDKGMNTEIPKIKLQQSINVNQVNLNIPDRELIEIGKKGIKNQDGTFRGPLALGLSHMKVIQDYFKKLDRLPNDIELESLAQTWSEHCKHTIFSDPIDDLKNGLFRTYIKASTEKIKKQKKQFSYSVFTDNSGAMEFDKQHLVTYKVETHNSPSAIDPFGGATTGILGVNRDALGFGLGAKPVINYYGFCFANPKNIFPIYRDKDLTNKMLPPQRIMNGVIAGVNTGGNCSGIPTPAGFVYFDDRYLGKPLVFVGTAGLIPKKIRGQKTYIKRAKPGDFIVMAGGKVGLDGIHGATFSSEALDSASPTSAVQIGDPITQKKLSDVIVKEARDLGLYNSITDNGAGGLSCSVAEMAKESGGCTVYLDKVPLKYPGLAPWQIWISESQERMTLAVPKRKWTQFHELMNRRGVEATIIGTFTKSGRCIVRYEKQTIMNLDMNFLHDGLPKRSMKTVYFKQKHKEPKFKKPKNLNEDLLQILKRNNIAGYEFISQQYDHEVQGSSVLKPLQGKGRINADATVTRPILSSKKGVVVSQGLYPSYSDIDTYHMAACAIDTAVRNAVAAGADLDNLALLDNFCWCSPDDSYRLGQLKQAAKACYDYASIYETPFISGKDSMFNDFKGFSENSEPIKISVPPTLLISSVGVIDDITKTVSIDFKFPGDLIYILGETKEELGGSEYFAHHSHIGNSVPRVDAKKNRRLYKAFYKCVKKELISSAISVGRGGLAVALAKSAMGGGLGIDVFMKKIPGKFKREDHAIFSESQGRIIVSIDPRKKKEFEKFMKGNIYSQIGSINNITKFKVFDKKGKKNIQADISQLSEAYKSTFKDY